MADVADVMADVLPALEDSLARDDWRFQSVNEGPFIFERAWLNVDEGRRAAIHRVPPRAAVTDFWHPHHNALGVLLVSDCLYQMRTRVTTVASPKPLSVVSSVITGPCYYGLSPGTWHTVTALGDQTSYSVVIFGNATDSADRAFMIEQKERRLAQRYREYDTWAHILDTAIDAAKLRDLK